MLYSIRPEERETFKTRLLKMHQQRERVFKGRLDWEVSVIDGMEFDEYDREEATYLLYYGHDGILKGSLRLLPVTHGKNMLRDTFPQLLDGSPAPASNFQFESSRFAVETENDEKLETGLSRGCIELFLGVIEYGLAHGKTELVTVTDIYVERIFRKAGWTSERIGKIHKIGNSRAVAVRLPISHDALQNIRQRNGISEPVLWTQPASLIARNFLTNQNEEIANIYSSLEFLRQRSISIGLEEIALKISHLEASITNKALEHGHG